MRKDMEIQISSESDEDGKTGLPKKSLRDFTIDEIIASEATYVGKLNELDRMIAKYLEERKYMETKLVPPPKNMVYGMHREIIQIQDFSQMLLKDLREKKDQIGTVFKKYGPFFKMYSSYMEKCETYMAAFRMYKIDKNPKFMWASLMIRPVQRIPRYQLLLRDLMNRTPSSHPDHKNIEEAMNIIISAAGSINETMKVMSERAEYAERFFSRFQGSKCKYPDKKLFDSEVELKKLNPMNRLLKTTTALKVTSDDRTHRVDLFLTQTHFAYCHEGSNRLARAVPLVKLNVDDGVDASHITSIEKEYLHWNAFPLLISNPPPIRSITFLFPSSDVRDVWSISIDQQKKILNRNDPKERERRNTLSVSQHRRSTIFKGDAAHQKWSLAAQIFATVQSSGKDKMYEYVKKEIRARYGKSAICDKNKHKLKSLAIAAPYCSFSRENQHPKWELASKLFGEKPFSNGSDKRYEEVKGIIRKKFGKSSINESNKARLKALALAGKHSKELNELGSHPKWKLAQKMFSQPPYSNGNDFRYEAVKNEIRFRWGKKSIVDKDKTILKALAVAAPYFVDMDDEDNVDDKDDSESSKRQSIGAPGVWTPNTSSCMRCNRSFGFLRIPHHCRKCGYCVCNKCSKHRVVVVLNEPPRRVCDYCVDGGADESTNDSKKIATKGKAMLLKSLSS